MSTARRALRRGAASLRRLATARGGRRALDRAVGDGLVPLELAPALGWLFGGPLPTDAADAVAAVEASRREVAATGARYRFDHSPDDPGVRWPVQDPTGDHTSEWFATVASVPERWGTFLHLCARAIEARTIVELGTCVGISGAYLASVPTRPRLLTFDASADLALHARRVLAAVAPSAEVVIGTFDETVAERITTLDIDLAFVDGHHDGPATIGYVELIAPRLRKGALVVLDDITLYGEMKDSWRALRAMPGFDVAIDVGRFGLLRWAGDASVAPVTVDLARWTGRWRARREQRPVDPLR